MRLSELLTAAIKHFSQHGYLNPHEADEWGRRIEEAANDPFAMAQERHRLRMGLEGAFKRAFSRGRLMRIHKKIEPWAAERLAPEARAELERRIYSATDLIRLNRKEAVAKTLQRFKGWVTSVPPAGLPDVAVAPVKRDMSKAAQETRWIARRVAVDQTAKMLANVDHIVATGAGAIGGLWNAEWEIERQHRKNHAAWDGLWFVQRGSWADEQGLVLHPNGYIGDAFGPPPDNTVMPALAINCRCTFIYIYDLEDVPPEMLTKAGREALARQQAAA